MGTRKVEFSKHDIEKYLDDNNHKKFTRIDLSNKFDIHCDTVDKWCEHLLNDGLISKGKIGKTRLFFSVDYMEPLAYEGAVVTGRKSYLTNKEYTPDRNMRAAMERCDMDRHAVILTSRVQQIYLD